MTKILNSFPVQVLSVLFLTLLVAAYPVFKYLSNWMIISIGVGCLLSLFNVLIGYIIIKKSLKKSTKSFFQYIIGGIGIRLFLIGGLVILFIKVIQLDEVGFLISMLTYYFLFLFMEVYYINRNLISSKNI